MINPLTHCKWGLTTATAAPPLPTTDTKKAKDLFSYARNLTLAERDIPSEANADGIAEFYSEVAGASDTTVVSEDNMGQTEISSSQFKYFDNSELNILGWRLERLHFRRGGIPAW